MLNHSINDHKFIKLTTTLPSLSVSTVLVLMLLYTITLSYDSNVPFQYYFFSAQTHLEFCAFSQPWNK